MHQGEAAVAGLSKNSSKMHATMGGNGKWNDTNVPSGGSNSL
jgi:hypothetical protein